MLLEVCIFTKIVFNFVVLFIEVHFFFYHLLLFIIDRYLLYIENLKKKYIYEFFLMIILIKKFTQSKTG